MKKPTFDFLKKWLELYGEIRANLREKIFFFIFLLQPNINTQYMTKVLNIDIKRDRYQFILYNFLAKEIILYH